MDFSRKLLSTLTGSHDTESTRSAEDATAFSEESIEALRSSISNPNIATGAMKENMLRLIYGDMMGLDVQFGAIYALQLAQSGQKVSEKRAGYLACYLLLQEGNELNIMLVNTLQKDLTSSNYHYVEVALVTLCNMTLPDILPSMVSHVLAALTHTHESVRKRALIALRNFYNQQPDLIVPHLEQIRESLLDPEPSVMSAALGFFCLAVKEHSQEMNTLVPVLVRILQQVIEGKLPKGYSYHGTPAPWIQIRCLQIMAHLGQQDLSASTAMTPVVMAAFHKARNGVDAAFGILFEVIRTLNSFHPEIALTLCQFKDKSRNPLLIIPKFATSSNQNLKYLGISMLCQVHPKAWSDAWWNDSLLAAVVDALESKDITIQRRALELLYRMLTLENSENIIDRLVHAFHQGHDEHREQEILREQELFGYDHRRVARYGPVSYREKILGQILDAAERFGKSEEKYLDLIVDLLGRGGPIVTTQTAERVMLVLEKGAKSPAMNTVHLRMLAIQKALDYLSVHDYKAATPPLAYFLFWVLGEYGQETEEVSMMSIMETLGRCLLTNQDPSIQALVLTALTKTTLKIAPNVVPLAIRGVVVSKVLDLQNARCVTGCNMSLHLDVQHRAHEFLMIAELIS